MLYSKRDVNIEHFSSYNHERDAVCFSSSSAPSAPSLAHFATLQVCSSYKQNMQVDMHLSVSQRLQRAAAVFSMSLLSDANRKVCEAPRSFNDTHTREREKHDEAHSVKLYKEKKKKKNTRFHVTYREKMICRREVMSIFRLHQVHLSKEKSALHEMD